MFTQRHYEAIAEVISAELVHGAYEYSGGVLALTESLADMFVEDNPNFNRAKFMAAAQKGSL